MEKTLARLAGMSLVLLLLSGCNLPGLSTPTPLATFVLPAETLSPVETVAPAQQLAPTPTSAPPTLVPTVAPPVQATPPTLPMLTSLNLRYIDMIDGVTGWGYGDQYVGYTQDGGQSWVNITPGGGFPASTSLSGAFLDAMHGWVLAPVADYSSGTIYRTQDAGRTWQSAPVPFAGASFDFLDATLGWAMVGTGAGAGSSAVDIYQTADGGSSWSRLYSLDPIPIGCTRGDCPLPDRKMASVLRLLRAAGWEAQNPWMATSGSLLRRMAGRTWQHQDLALPAGFENAMTSVDAPIFANMLEGVLPVQLFAGDLVATVFYRTSDGGLTWQATRPVTLIGQFSVSSMSDFWVWDGKTLVASYDGGQTWQSIPANINLADNLSQLDFVAPAQGWALGMDANSASTLYQTVDGGYTWTLPGGQPLAAAPSPTAVITTAAAPTITPASNRGEQPGQTRRSQRDRRVRQGRSRDRWRLGRVDTGAI